MLTPVNILKVLDLSIHQIDQATKGKGDFREWLRQSLEPPYSDTVSSSGSKEHLYNITDITDEDDEQKPTGWENFKEIIEAIETLCRQHEAPYFRIVID